MHVAILWFHFCHTAASKHSGRFEAAIRMTVPAMPSGLVEAIGAAGAVLTTLCWVPQAAKIIRERDTRAISLPGTALCVIGVLLWLVYGLAIVDGPLIGSSIVTFAMTFIILVLKIRHG
jgi:MtN3 and saliva related transmembrane protein